MSQATSPAGSGRPAPSRADARAARDEVPLWYHSIELAPGVVTPGWFDLRPIVDRIPWPDLSGARCLDVATYDGFLAFEMERRGASEVVAVDIASHEDWDWLPRDRAKGPEHLAALAGPKGRGFEVAAKVLGSSVERQFVNVYDLDPDRIGTFDLVVCGNLLLHLRDPLRALEAIRTVTGEHFLSLEMVDPISTLAFPRRPMFHLFGRRQQWLKPNVAGHRWMLEVTGFDEVEHSTFTIPPGTGFRAQEPAKRQKRRVRARHARNQLLERALFRGSGVLPSSAVLTKVAI